MRGAPRKDGDRFACGELTTHGPPTATWTHFDARGAPLTISCWTELHCRQAREMPVTVICIERHTATGSRRDPRVSWFLWRGAALASLKLVWLWYRRRFGLEHGYRFQKQLVKKECKITSEASYDSVGERQAESIASGLGLPLRTSPAGPALPMK